MQRRYRCQGCLCLLAEAIPRAVWEGVDAGLQVTGQAKVHDTPLCQFILREQQPDHKCLL